MSWPRVFVLYIQSLSSHRCVLKLDGALTLVSTYVPILENTSRMANY